MPFDSDSLITWFQAYKRPLPWRGSDDPYAVWVSEIMLQQTQVAVVLPYFTRWMEAFPTIQSLAEAPLDLVIKMWEGLGYYSRARSLHKGAKYLLEHHEGTLSNDPELFKALKGIGPYTEGAIRSFAFHEPVPAVDGNVARVLARYFALPEEIKSTRGQKALWSCAKEIIPQENHWLHNEALIELGATICTKTPLCTLCPLQVSCQAHQQNRTSDFPIQTKKTVYEKITRVVGCILSKDAYLVRRVEKGLMRDLWEFPFLQKSATAQEPLPHREESERAIALEYLEKSSEELLIEEMERLTGVKLDWKGRLPLQEQQFTRFRVTLLPHLFETAESRTLPGWEWVDREQLSQLSFSSGHRRIMRTL